jgi:hypothetical protein
MNTYIMLQVHAGCAVGQTISPAEIVVEPGLRVVSIDFLEIRLKKLSTSFWPATMYIIEQE